MSALRHPARDSRLGLWLGCLSPALFSFDVLFDFATVSNDVLGLDIANGWVALCLDD